MRGRETGRRILHCIPNMAGGGAERQLTYLAGGLVERGWAVSVAIVGDGPHFDRLLRTGARIHRMVAAGSYDPRIVLQIRGIVRADRAEIIQTWLTQMDIFGGLAARATGRPWILSERSSERMYRNGWKNGLRARIGRTATAIASNSAGGRAYWATHAGDRVLQAVIPNGVPWEEIAASESAHPAEIGLRPEQELLLSVGRRSEEKNLATLLRAYREVLGRGSRVAVFCGQGYETPASLGPSGRDLPPESVRTLGFVPSVWRWMKRASALVSVGFFEGMPNAVLEAMACGCPVVVSDIPAHREFLDGRSAVFVDPHDCGSIAAGIERCLTRRDDAQTRSECARECVRRWSIQSMVDRYEALYEEVLQRSSVNRRRAWMCVRGA